MAELSRPIDKEFNVEVEGGRFSTEFLNDLVDTHVNKIAPRYIKFQKLYEGKHKIQNRPRKDKNKPNNKLVNDFFGQTIDNTVGYFLGNPIVLNYTEPKKDKAPVEADPADVGVDLTELEDTAVQDELDKICSDNDKDDLFIEWNKEAMIKGLSHILVYQDEESHTKMMRVSPEDLIIVYKNSSTKEPAYKIRLYDIDTEETKKTTHYAEVYSPTKIETFKCVDDGSCATTGKGKARQFASYEFVEEKSHIFGRIPIITVYNNEEQMSDLEKIETLVNDYDKVLSDVSNEFEAFRNAYLMLKNMVTGNDSIQKLKDEGIVAKAETPELKYILEQIERTLNNMFIETADEYGIKRFEDMMGIYPEAGASLETRRFNVLVKWNDKVPYTEKELYNRLISICGDDNFSVNPDYKNYFLEIITHLGIEGAFDTISSILQDMIPCNLVLDLKNTLEEGNTTPFSVAVVSCVAMRYQITNDINPKVATESPMYYGVGLGRAGTHIITHDIKSTVNQSSDLNVAQALSTGGSSGAITMDIAVKDEVESPHYEGVGVGMAFTKIITHDINSKATNSGNTTVASPVNTATVITIN